MRSLVDVGDWIRCMVVVPGETEVVCGCANGEMMVVDMKESIVKKRWKAHDIDIKNMVISAIGGFVVSVPRKGAGKMWEITSWSYLRTLEIDSKSVARMSSDERYVITGGADASIRFWDVETGECAHIIKTDLGPIYRMAVLTDGECYVAGKNSLNLSLWKVADVRVLNQMHSDDKKDSRKESVDYNKLTIHLETEMTCIEVNDDESNMVTGHENGSIQVWDVKSMSPINDPWIAHDAAVSSLSFSTDGTKVVSGSRDGTIRVWDASTGNLIRHPFLGHMGSIVRVQFVDSDHSVVSCSKDGTVRLWTMDQYCSEDSGDTAADNVTCVSCSPNGSCFVTGHEDGRLHIWNAVTGKMIEKPTKVRRRWIYDVAVTPDSQLIISVGSDCIVTVSDWDTLEEIKSFQGHKKAVYSVEISRLGTYAVTRSWDDTIRIWDLNKFDGSHETFNMSFNYIRNVFISTDEQRIIVRTRSVRDQFIEVWNIKNKKKVRRKVLSHDAWELSREEIMCAAEEPQETEKNVFCRLSANEILYGNRSNSIVLGTLESFIEEYEYSELYHKLAIVSNNKLRFIRLEL